MTKQEQTEEPANKQITIELNEIKNPHPALIASYKSQGAEELCPGYNYQIPAWELEKRVFMAANASQTKPKHNVFGLYRRQETDGKEWFFAFEKIWANDYMGTKVDTTREIGRHDEAVINRSFSVNVANIAKNKGSEIKPEAGPAEVESTSVVYDIPFEQMHDQILSWRKNGVIPEDAHYYVMMGSEKFGGFSLENWLNLSVDDLKLLNTYGKKLAPIFKAEETAEMINAIKTQLKTELQAGVLK